MNFRNAVQSSKKKKLASAKNNKDLGTEVRQENA